MRSTTLTLAALALLTVGCDTSGIHPLGEVLDITPVCDPIGDADHTTWYRTMVNGSAEPIGTEIVVFGFDPKAAPTSGLHCMQRIKIFRSTTTEEHLGIVTLTGPGTGTQTEEVRCSFPQEPTRAVLSRRGAECFDLAFDGYIESDLAFAMSAGNILEITWAEDEAPLRDEDLTGDGDPRAPEMADRVPAGTYRYKEVGDVLASLDLATIEGATGVFQIYNSALLASQARLAGFGSGGMTRYLNSTSMFTGLIRNSYEIGVINALMPRTTIRYTDFEELTGVVIGSLAGDDQITVVNISGNGGMTGALNFYLRRDRTDPASAIVGSLDYIETEVVNGFGAAGNYLMHLDETNGDWVLDVAAVIGYDAALPGYGNYDLSPILPPGM